MYQVEATPLRSSVAWSVTVTGLVLNQPLVPSGVAGVVVAVVTGGVVSPTMLKGVTLTPVTWWVTGSMLAVPDALPAPL